MSEKDIESNNHKVENETDEEEEENEDEEEEEDCGVEAEPLATTRARRSNAGNRMSKMIQEEEDEFYSSLYGGFHEEEDDIDFDSDDDEVESDYDVDSDFSIDETDEIAPEHQAVDEEPKKKRGVYRDPKPKGYSSTQSGPSSSTPVQSKPKPSSSATPQSPSKNRAERSFRDSTRKKTEETIKNIQTGTRKKKKKSRNLEAWKPLTQEEMLSEAKITEEENTKSLETYQRLELEKLKKLKQVKKTLPPPYITYLSTTMPDLERKGRYTRNFMTFVT